MKGLFFIGSGRIVRADHVFDVIEGFGLDVVIEPGFNPIGERLIFADPPAINSIGTNPKLLCKLFFSQTSFFEKLLKFLIGHCIAFVIVFDKKIIPHLSYTTIIALTILSKTIIIFFESCHIRQLLIT